jgi:hypothetical protein
MDGALFEKLHALNSTMAVFSLFLSLISLILWFVDCASMGMSILATMTRQCSYLLVYYYPCVSQFLTTQKEGENCMSLIFLNVRVQPFSNLVGSFGAGLETCHGV